MLVVVFQPWSSADMDDPNVKSAVEQVMGPLWGYVQEVRQPKFDSKNKYTE